MVDPGRHPLTLLYAHRGAHHERVENTLAAFRAAIEQGADGVELDVRRCASGEVVVLHDPTLERVAARPEAAHALPWSTLRTVALEDGERIPLLDEALDLVLAAGRRVNVEVKGDVPDRLAVARAVARLLARRGRTERAAVVLSSFDPVVLAALRALAGDVPAGYLFDQKHTGTRRAAIVIAGLRPVGLHPHAPLCTPRRVRAWKARDRFINVWTVNEAAEAKRLVALGVDGIITDDVPALRAALGR